MPQQSSELTATAIVAIQVHPESETSLRRTEGFQEVEQQSAVGRSVQLVIQVVESSRGYDSYQSGYINNARSIPPAESKTGHLKPCEPEWES